MNHHTSEMIAVAARDIGVASAISYCAAKLKKPAVMLLVPLSISNFNFRVMPETNKGGNK